MNNLYVGNDEKVVLTLTDAETGDAITSATITMTLTDLLGVEVTGGDTWPVSLIYDSNTVSDYVYVLPHTTNLEAGRRYRATFIVDAGTDKNATFVQIYTARVRSV